MALFDARPTYGPFEYTLAYNIWKNARVDAYWHPFNQTYEQDVMDFRTKLDDKERSLIGHTLKSFTQIELIVGNEHWSKMATWFPKPEIQMMCLQFASDEMNHTVAYSQIDENLGIKDYAGFLEDPIVRNKMDMLATKCKTREEKALSLAIFSAFTEGVCLFSAFAILLNFKRRKLLPGIGKIITYSIRDESMHSAAGCWLFRTLSKEYDIMNDEFKKKVYDAARLAVQLEDDFIDKAFEMGDVTGLAKHDLKQFIRHRANSKLKELGLKMNWKTIDTQAVRNIDEWFSLQSGGSTLGDFFYERQTDYAKGNKNFSNVLIRRVM
jgi:ribonucleoside-diphosphate reductase beta chain